MKTLRTINNINIVQLTKKEQAILHESKFAALSYGCIKFSSNDILVVEAWANCK